MVLNNIQTHIAYRCPACGTAVMGFVGKFALSAGMVRLKCSCTESHLDINVTSDKKLRLTVPCVFCKKSHSFTLSQTIFFERDSFLLNCPYSNMDIAFIGEKEKVDENLQRTGEELTRLGDDCICLTAKGKPIKAKTVGQKQYVDAIRKNTIVLGVGPAGTGKTFLAVAMAVRALKEKQVNRIILTRPAIEAGEKLGFLPGDLQSKIDPYLRPLYDALYEMLGVESYQKLVEKNVIEIAPLAYMRGRTLDDSFIILDEAQNATPEQMKMFLTRLGFNSKAVVTGDLTQTDLPRGQKSGLATAVKILSGIDDIAIHTFDDRDVVRHRLVQKIILAYEKHDRELARRAAERQAAEKQKFRAERKEK